MRLMYISVAVVLFLAIGVSSAQSTDNLIVSGEIFGFLGPNGSGKTTTIRTMLDEIRPTAGRASILGLDTHDKAVEIRRHIGRELTRPRRLLMLLVPEDLEGRAGARHSSGEGLEQQHPHALGRTRHR